MNRENSTPTIIGAHPGYFVAIRYCRGSDDEMKTKLDLSAVIGWAVFCSVQKGEDDITSVDVLPVTTFGIARIPDWLLRSPDGHFIDCDDVFSSTDEQAAINYLNERHARRWRTAEREREKCASM